MILTLLLLLLLAPIDLTFLMRLLEQTILLDLSSVIVIKAFSFDISQDLGGLAASSEVVVATLAFATTALNSAH